MKELKQQLADAVGRQDFQHGETVALAILADAPADHETWFLLGVCQRANGKPAEAIKSYHTALQGYPHHPDVWFNLANAHRQLQQPAECRHALEQALHYNDRHDGALSQLASLLQEQGDYLAAAAIYARRIAIQPNQGDDHAQRVKSLRLAGQWDEAHRAFQAGLQYALDHSNLLIEGGLVLEQLGEYRALAVLYQRLDGLMTDNPMVKFHLGLNRLRINQNTPALEALRAAEALGLSEKALWVNLGTALARLDQTEEAIRYLHRAAPTFADDPSAFVFAFALQQKLCDWTGFDQLADSLLKPALEDHGPGTYPALPFPFTAFPGTITEAEQYTIARRFGHFLGQKAQPFASHPWQGQHDRIRLGYLSADFHNHATAHLMQGLFKRHDRSRFEIYAYSYGPDDGSDYRKRIRAEVDHFVDLAPLADRDAALRIHADQIDVLVDLKGYTREARTQILAWRPAPVQVAWLGYPGTMGVDYLDYVITDAQVTPPEQQVHYSEKFLYMPGSYQINDDEQAIAEHIPSRADVGLPETGFVFCCFCAHYKIEPQAFASWMRLLKQVPGSVLWLIDGYEAARRNLRAAAEQQGVDPARLVFAPRADKAEHLARHALADLFLDTYFYNAHTTMSDALWAGLPAITLRGQTFASRVGSSLLKACGLEELITDSVAAYETLALGLARDTARLGELKTRVKQTVRASALFDTEGFARALEAHLLQITPLGPRLAGVQNQQLQLLSQSLTALQAEDNTHACKQVESLLNDGLDRPDAWNLYGVALRRLEQPESAGFAYQQGLALKPDFADLMGNWGNLLRDQDRMPEALQLYQQGLHYAPDNLTPYTNLGSALNAVAQPGEALAVWEQAISRFGRTPDLEWDRALDLLMLGQVQAGLEAYECRFARKQPAMRDYPQPLWQGEPLEGKRILVHWEQGYGDSLQFLRYIPLLAQRNATVVMEVQPGLKRLVAQLKGVSEVVDAGEPLPDFDCFVPLLSLPRLLECHSEADCNDLPYLQAADALVQAWHDKLGKKPKSCALRVGLVWAGNPNVKSDRLRSPRLKPLLPLLQSEGIEWILLQQGDGRKDLQGIKLGRHIRDMASEVTDFADTAALMQNLDLVISSDTSTAHLAAAVGVPTWVLLSYASDWRWGLGEESPWYPGVKLIRQMRYADWSDVVKMAQYWLAEKPGIRFTGPPPQSPPPKVDDDLFHTAFRNHAEGKLWLARQQCRAALQAHPERFDGWCLLGVIEKGRQQLAAAESAYRQAIALSPQYADGWFNLGNLYRHQKQLPQAQEAYQQAANYGAGAKALSLLSDVQRELQQLELAEQTARQALKLQPDMAEAWGHLGNALNDQERFAEAATCYDRALQLPNCPPETLYNKGVALQRSRQVPEAIRCYREIIAAKPAEALAHYNLSTSLMTLGYMREGLAEYEWRLRKGDLQLRSYPQPVWQGEPLAGKRILLYWEQGYGDSLQFMRFVPLVAKAGGQIILEMQAGLAPLLTDLPGVIAAVDSGDPLPPFDVHAPLLSVAALLGLDTPDLPPPPYLTVPSGHAARWQGRVSPSPRLKIGFIWAGNPNVKNDRVRSPRLAPLRHLWDLPGIDWYILQQGDGRRDLEGTPLPGNVIDVATDVKEFADTAALMQQLDLVLTSDTSTAHLAAALGVPTWVMLHYAADWRWCEGEQTLWYPEARLFRQPQPGDWTDVVTRLEIALKAASQQADLNVHPSLNAQTAENT